MNDTNRLSAIEAAALIASGKLTAVKLAEDCLARVAAREEAVQAWAHIDPQQVLADARARDAEKPRSPLPTRSSRHKGHHRHGRHADGVRIAHLRRTPAARRRRLRDASQKRRRRDHGQDRHRGVRHVVPREDPKSAQFRAYAGRVIEWIRSGCRRSHGAARARNTNRWLGAAAGGVLRHRGFQAHVRCDQHGRREAEHEVLRYGRHHGTQRRRRRAHVRRDDPQGRIRIRSAAHRQTAHRLLSHAPVAQSR